MRLATAPRAVVCVGAVMVRSRTSAWAAAALALCAACTAPATGVSSRGTALRAGAEMPVDPVRFEGSLPTTPGRVRASLAVAGQRRTLSLLVPERREGRPALLVILHGTRADGAGIIDECGAIGLANHEGVVVAAPDAREMPEADWDHPEQSGETWWETHPDADPDRNPDLLFVRAVIAAARRDLRVDPSRVYVMGHSNGAFFGLLVASALGDRVAGVALNSGGLVRCATSGACRFRAGQVADCGRYPSMPGWCRCEGPPLPVGVPASGPRVPFVLSHGTDDPDVSVQYTCELARELQGAGHPVTLHLRPGDGHFCDGDFVERSWRQLTAGRSGGP